MLQQRATKTPLTPSKARTINPCERASAMEKSSSSNKENKEAAKVSQGLLSKVCSKLLKSGRSGRRAEKCEKCGERSNTCRPNASFISGRKHFLCDTCRVSSNKMKNMYSQLSRNLRDPTTWSPTGLDPSNKHPVVDSSTVWSTCDTGRPQATDSGYETATSLNSSCSYGRLSPDPVMSTDSAGRSTQHADNNSHQSPDSKVFNDSSCFGKTDVFGGAFTPEMDHLQALSLKGDSPVHIKQQRVYTRQQKSTNPKNGIKNGNVAISNYDGYLDEPTSKADLVKFVFNLDGLDKFERDTEQQGAQGQQPEDKLCYRCHKSSAVAFRAPFQRGWLCEDCMDDLL